MYVCVCVQLAHYLVKLLYLIWYCVMVAMMHGAQAAQLFVESMHGILPLHSGLLKAFSLCTHTNRLFM